MLKNPFIKDSVTNQYQVLINQINALENNLRILHPFIPFASEEIWQNIAERTPDEALIINNLPEVEAGDKELLNDFDLATQIITGVRAIRKEKNISFKEELELYVMNTEGFTDRFNGIIKKLCNLSTIETTTASKDGALSFRVKANEYFIPLTGAIDIEAELAKIEEELNYTRGFMNSVTKKLSNERFVSGAPEQVVAIERQKQADAQSKIDALEKRLAALK